MKFYFHPLADTEFDEAVRYYEECEPGLGLELAEEVYSAIRRVSEYPEAWSAMSQNTSQGRNAAYRRRCQPASATRLLEG